MSDAVLSQQCPSEFFREAVSEALASRKLRIQEQTEFYLVDLLASRVLRRAPDAGGAEDEPLALILGKALAGDRRQRYRELKRLGDTALFLSGFFSDRLARSAAGAGYYAAMGERAYGWLAEGRLVPPGLEALYEELARRFGDLADLLAEIAELSDLRSNRGLVRLYQRFLHTGSQRLAARLQDRGVALLASFRQPRNDIH